MHPVSVPTIFISPFQIQTLAHAHIANRITSMDIYSKDYQPIMHYPDSTFRLNTFHRSACQLQSHQSHQSPCSSDLIPQAAYFVDSTLSLCILNVRNADYSTQLHQAAPWRCSRSSPPKSAASGPPAISSISPPDHSRRTLHSTPFLPCHAALQCSEWGQVNLSHQRPRFADPRILVAIVDFGRLRSVPVIPHARSSPPGPCSA